MNKGMRYEDLALIKTAGDMEEQDYNIKVPVAGNDIPVEDNGYDLVETIAHPGQIQVANSLQNDGIIENGVQAQKVMMDVALRNPRGVLVWAELMNTLVKSANVLDKYTDNASLSMIAEIDTLLEKMAQQSVLPNSQFNDILEAVQNVLKSFAQIIWHGAVSRVSGADESEPKIDRIIFQLKRYAVAAASMKTDAQKQQWASEVAAVVKANDADVRAALEDARVPAYLVLQGLPVEQKNAWNQLVMVIEQVSAPVSSPLASSPAKQEPTEGRTPHFVNVPRREQSQMPSRSPSADHHYSVHGGAVGVLQNTLATMGLLSAKDIDGKFGPKTYAAVQSAAKDNYDLRELLHNAPELMSGYEKWTNDAVNKAVDALNAHEQPQAAPSLVPSPTRSVSPNELAWQSFKAQFSDKYPALEIENGILYPYGKADGRAYRVTSDGRWQKIEAKPYERLDKNQFVDKATGRVYNVNNPVPLPQR